MPSDYRPPATSGLDAVRFTTPAALKKIEVRQTGETAANGHPKHKSRLRNVETPLKRLTVKTKLESAPQLTGRRDPMAKWTV